MAKPEAQLQRLVLDYLAARRILAFRMNTGAMHGEYKGKRRFMRFGVPGMADVLAFRVRERGTDDQGTWCSFTEIRPLWLECKAPKGVQSELQKSFQAQVEAEGHVYAVIRSIEDLERVL